MALKSKLFTVPPSDKLNNCAKNDPDHIFQGANDQGDHVGRIQTALLRLRNSDPSLGLPAIGVEDLGNERYGKSTAAAVLQYKKKRNIIRPGQRLDNIVGIGTMASLDKDMVKFENRPSIPDLPLPPIDPTPVPQSITRRIILRKFRKLDTVFASGDPRAADAKEQSDAVIGLLTDALAPEAALAPFENISERRIASLPADHRVNRVTTVVETNLQLLAGGAGTLTITTTTISYEWGPPLPFVSIVKTTQVTGFEERRSPSTTSRSLPRATAEQTAFVVPPNP